MIRGVEHMKIFWLMLVAVLLLSLTGLAQDAPLQKRVSVEYRKIPVMKALKDLEASAGVQFRCAEKLLEGLSFVNYTGTNQEAGRVATRILRPRGLKLEGLDGRQPSVVKVGPLDEFKVKREEVYGFAEKPSVTRAGDKVTIEFVSKGWCDVTVAIEEAAGGKIVRHLASGVLGENAPQPFLWNSKKQTLVWDGKDDQGRYVDDTDAITVRVSLGLKPQFERTLFWCPQKRVGVGSRPIIACAPEGVYVHEGEGVDMIRLFDHDGNYVKTIYPFASDQIKKVKGLSWQRLPQSGEPVPVKSGHNHHSTLLKSGLSTSMGIVGVYQGEHSAGTALAVGHGRIALAGLNLARLSPSGGHGGLDVLGPQASVSYRNANVLPRSIAFSPDGKHLYLTGFVAESDKGWGIVKWLHGVAKIAFNAGKDVAPTVFAGKLDVKSHGAGPNQLNTPTSVACDAQGRVYVTDYLNDRVQVFTPDGKLFKSIRTARPALLQIHHKTRELYIFSHYLGDQHRGAVRDIKATLTRLGPVEDPKKIAEYPLPLNGHKHNGLQYNMALDAYTQPPTIWVVPGKAGNAGVLAALRGVAGNEAGAQAAQLKILVVKDKALEVKRDFGKDVFTTVKRARAPVHSKQRLFVNPATQKLYVWEGDSGIHKSCKQLVEIDPDSGSVKTIDLPFTTEDLAFGPDGLVYLRTDTHVARFDLSSWREVTWDYGAEQEKPGFDQDGAKLISTLVLPVKGRPGYNHQGGMGISPKGHLVVSCYNLARKETRQMHLSEGKNIQIRAGRGGLPYTAPLYPGRYILYEFHVWDRHGKVLFEDAIPGLDMTDGVMIDGHDNLYALASASRLLRGKTNPLKWTETLLKVVPGQSRLIGSAPLGPQCPLPLEKAALPSRPPDMRQRAHHDIWIERPEWLYGGVGSGGVGYDEKTPSITGCSCWNARAALDYLARVFVPEVNHYTVAVLDTNGNLITRIGRYGNVDEGRPLIIDGGPPKPRSIGGDEVALFHAAYVGTSTDRRLFISDGGNRRILSVKLGYHADAKIPLKNVPNIKR